MADEDDKTKVIAVKPEAAEADAGKEAAEAEEASALAAQEEAIWVGRARRMGWRPKEEYRGPAERWVPAKDFVERGETELPVIRERYRALDDRFAKLEERSLSTERSLTTQLKEMSSAFDEFRAFASKGEERAFKRAKAELDARMEAAVQSADHASFRAAKAELDALEDTRPEPAPVRKQEPKEEPKAATQQMHPEVATWIADNPWMGSDARGQPVNPEMQNYAVALHGRLLRERPGLSMRENLAEVREDVVARFPEKFENKRREAAAAVSTVSTAAAVVPKRKGKYPEYNEWPADAKAAYAKFSRAMPGYTKDEYAKVYFAGDEK